MRHCHYDFFTLQTAIFTTFRPLYSLVFIRCHFLILGNLPGIQNLTLYLNHTDRQFSFCSPYLVGISHQPLFAFFTAIETRTRDWTRNLCLLRYLTWCLNPLNYVSRCTHRLSIILGTEEGQRVKWLKCCEYHNQDEYSSLQSVENNIRNVSSTCWYYLPNPSTRAGYDTRSIFKRSLTGLNSEFSFS